MWRGALALLLAGGLLLAAGLGGAEAAPLRRLGQNPRGLAMGGTGVSYADDEMAFFYNPAGLGSIDTYWVELLPLAVEYSDEARDLISSDAGTFDSPSQFIRDHIGDELQFRGFVYPHAVVNVFPGLTFGGTYFIELQTEVKLRNQATPEAEAFFREDKGQTLAISFPTVEGQLLWGLGYRSLERTTGEGVISSADLAISSAKGELDVEKLLGTATGSGSAFDVGMIWRMETLPALRGQFALVVQNVGGLDLGDAGELPQEISLGWSFRPRLTPLFPMLIALEFRDVTNELTDDSSTAKRTHFGVEFGILPLDSSTNLLSFRAGVNGSAISYGIEFSAWHSFTLQWVIYEVEYGEVSGEDTRKRNLLQLNILGF